MPQENPVGMDLARLAAVLEFDLLTGAAFPQLDRLTGLAADICGADSAAFTVHDATLAYQISTSFGVRDVMPNVECICTVAMDGAGPVLLDDARNDPKTKFYRNVKEAPHVRSFAAAAVRVDNGPVIGVLAVGHVEPARFGAREVARLERVAELVSAFLAERRQTIRAERAAATTQMERQRQLQFEQIFNALHEGVNVHAQSGEVVEMNPACLEILGVTREEMQSQDFLDPRWRAFRGDGTPFPNDEFPVAQTLRTGASFQAVPMGIELPSGDIRWISINSVPLRNASTGEVEFAAVTFNDITGSRKAEERIKSQHEALQEALARAESANRAKTDFMGVMSHELRTPMNAVLGCAKLLAQSKLDAGQLRTLGVLQDAGRQMLALLNDLLDLSSLNADKVRIQREPVSLTRLIEDAAVIWSADVRAKGLSLAVMVDPGLTAPRDVDAGRVLQIIGNLMSNAIKFTSSGGVSLQAWPVGKPGEARRVEIEVEDSGVGLQEEAIARIFSPFEQVDVSARRRHGGLGLGLHVAKRLANAMGGDITVSSRPGEGSRFTVTLDAPLSVTPQAVAANDDAGPPTRLMDILCVDDNPRNLFVLSALLRSVGHRTHECASGGEALDLLGRERFDLVLLDMVMPDIDGLEVLSRLRTGRGMNCDTPVIACTANVLPDQIEAYRRAGTNGVLAKPIDVRAMLQAVADAA